MLKGFGVLGIGLFEDSTLFYFVIIKILGF